MFHIQDLYSWSIYNRKSSTQNPLNVLCLVLPFYIISCKFIRQRQLGIFLCTAIGLTFSVSSVKGRILTVFLQDLGRKWIKADWPSPRDWNKIVHFHIFDKNFREIPLSQFSKNRLWIIQKSLNFCENQFFP